MHVHVREARQDRHATRVDRLDPFGHAHRGTRTERRDPVPCHENDPVLDRTALVTVHDPSADEGESDLRGFRRENSRRTENENCCPDETPHSHLRLIAIAD